jgi:hypothetical protein
MAPRRVSVVSGEARPLGLVLSRGIRGLEKDWSTSYQSENLSARAATTGRLERSTGNVKEDVPQKGRREGALDECACREILEQGQLLLVCLR